MAVVETFTPPEISVSAARPASQTKPSSSTCPRSPVWKKPAGAAGLGLDSAAGASGWEKGWGRPRRTQILPSRPGGDGFPLGSTTASVIPGSARPTVPGRLSQVVLSTQGVDYSWWMGIEGTADGSVVVRVEAEDAAGLLPGQLLLGDF